MGKLTVSMAIFNSYLELPEGNHSTGDTGDVLNMKHDTKHDMKAMEEIGDTRKYSTLW